jgi:hypothetical protein
VHEFAAAVLGDNELGHSSSKHSYARKLFFTSLITLIWSFLYYVSSFHFFSSLLPSFHSRNFDYAIYSIPLLFPHPFLTHLSFTFSEFCSLLINKKFINQFLLKKHGINQFLIRYLSVIQSKLRGNLK